MEKSSPPRSGWYRMVRLAGGTVLVVMGVLGLLLPILPGWVFLIPGLAILSTVTPRVRQGLRAVRDRIPRKFAPIRGFFHRLQALARRKKKKTIEKTGGGEIRPAE